ncbi:hypothetical protein XBJ1_2137 [Xenorhabdus bovienii SS-2004]|uniref:H repeat-associated protein N-terminal domain-containing protein n=1 Tax=Xenorhabdus bovienii (strain SS-2004) TaxID=406818 RepID=D3V3E8_XENBS|nr:hypothetical protein XBJ1_2137 [Xenorhabdus bovienii SS-2004]
MSIFNFIRKIDDPRSDINKKHELMDVIFLAFSAVLCGASGWKSIQEFGELQIEWLKECLKPCMWSVLMMLNRVLPSAIVPPKAKVRKARLPGN